MTTMVEGEDYIFKEEKGEVWLTEKVLIQQRLIWGIDNLLCQR